MKKTIALVLMTAVWLSGCSGRTDEAVAEDPNDPLVIAAAQAANGQIRVLTTSPSLLTGGTESASIIAIVTDDNNRAIEGQEVVFSSDGGVLQNIVSATNESGEATAQLSLAGDYRNRNIAVTASMGAMNSTVLVAATGTALEMTSPESIVIGDTPELVFTLLAGSGQPIPNQVLAVRSDAGNTFSQNSGTTDASGAATFVVSTNAGADVLTAVALDATVDQSFPLTVVDNVQAVETPIRIRVISNESSIETGGNDIARITTLVTDENNRVISGKDVEFSSTGGVLQNISPVTSAAGQATAELSLAGDFRNQDITVTANVDDQEGSVLISTSGSTLSIAGPTALVSGNQAELEVVLTGGNDQPISNEVISITSLAGNSLSADTVTTDATGKALITVGSTAGDDVITVSALNSTVVKEHAIKIAADVLVVVEIDGYDYSSLEVGAPRPFKVLWESNGQPVAAGQPLKFSMTNGELWINNGTVAVPDFASFSANQSVATDAQGIATIYVSSSAAGPATIAFYDENDPNTVSQYEIEFTAVEVSKIIAEASPASVAAGNPSTVFAYVTDEFGNPVRDIVVEFSSDSLKGGTISPVNAVTDSDGQARTTFTAGSTATETDELVIEAVASGWPAIASAQVSLTVTERQLNVIIGLAGNLTEADSDTRYRKAGLVQVTDGAGRPVPDAAIDVSMIPTIYAYGQLVGIDTDNDGELDAWGPSYTLICQSEDINGNRILDDGEDLNLNGVLDPSDPGLVDADPVNVPTVIGGQITTDANGVGFFSIAYPQSNAWWFETLITARVQALGVEGVADYDFPLVPVADDVNDYAKSPPNAYSPYGVMPTAEDSLCRSL